ncbi:hypothetical protein SEUCBS140593_009045 [Sporothrix eucalyptigena]|uniref:Uncharacterized protein n=1 Tax=Sporothrix eucalyptigena TaxID=1812306 RepID=A0ABP0CU67_9PEZI
MEMEDAPDASGAVPIPRTSNSITVVPPDRDLFSGRSNPMTFTLSYRPRSDDDTGPNVAPSSPAKTGAIAPPSSPVVRSKPKSKFQTSIQRHVTKSITLDASAYANHSRYSQKQFDEEDAEEELEQQQWEKDNDRRMVAMDMDFEQAFRQHRANNKLSGRGRRRQGPFSHLPKESGAGRAAGGAPLSADGDPDMHIDSRLHLHHRDTSRVHRGGRISKRGTQPRRKLPSIWQMMFGDGGWKAEELLDCLPASSVRNTLNDLCWLEFNETDKSSTTQETIKFLGTIMADPTVIKNHKRQYLVRNFLIKLMILAPSSWSWKPDNSQQPPWVLPNITALSIGNGDGNSMETEGSGVAPAPCSPEDSAFWTWLAIEVSKAYAEEYALRTQTSAPSFPKGVMALHISDSEDGCENSALALGRRLQALVDLLVDARQRFIEANPDHLLGPVLESDGPDNVLSMSLANPWMSFKDICTNLDERNTRYQDITCLSRAVDIWCMWREQGRPGQPAPSWTQTWRPRYISLGRWAVTYPLTQSSEDTRARQMVQDPTLSPVNDNGVSWQDQMQFEEDESEAVSLRW